MPALAGTTRCLKPGGAVAERDESMVCVGAIAGAFGVRGEARVKSFCAEPAAIAGYGPLSTEDGRSFDLRITREVKGGFATRLSGVATREDRSVYEAIDRAFREIDPALAVYGMTTMQALQHQRTSQDRLGAIVSAVFAVFGLILAGFSLYGLLSYSVELRRGEMGIRLALGATRGSIVALVMRQAATRLVAGTIVGVGLALGVNQMLRAAIEGLDWVPWQTMLWLALLMAVVTAIAAAVPAVRATRVDPIRSLRA